VQAQAVQQKQFLSQNEREMVAALNKFIERYPDVARDPDLGNTGMAVLGRVLKSELRRVPGVNEAELNAIPNDMNGVRAMAHGVAIARGQGHKLRDFNQILDATGGEMSRKFGLRPGSVHSDRRIGTDAEIQARLERKRSMPYQPRPAGVRMAPQEYATRPKDRRRDRGGAARIPRVQVRLASIMG